MKKISLAWQMVIGLILGVIVGVMVDTTFASQWLNPLGQLFIRLIRMVVVPLVIATLIAGAANIADVSKLGRMASKTLLLYVLDTALAVIFGLLIAGFIDPGHGLNLATDGLVAKKVTAPPLVQTLLNIVPMNPMESMSKGSMLQVIFFAVMFGFSLASLGEKGKPLVTFFDLVGQTMIRVTNTVMYFAPVGVFGLISFTVARHGLSVLLPLGKLILASLAATVAYFLIIQLPAVRLLAGIKCMTFIKGIAEPWLIAFTTCSSAASLPANMVASRRLGSTKAITSFSIPLGNTVNMAGTSIYMGVTAIFAAAVFGVNLSFADQVTIVLMGVLAAVGTAGVPGAGLIMTTIVFTQVGIPLEAVAIIAGIDRVLDMIRTSINVTGDVAVSLIVARWEKVLHSERLEEGEGKPID